MESENDDDILSGSQPKGAGTQGATRCVAEECDSQVTPGTLQDLDELIEDFDDEDWGLLSTKDLLCHTSPWGIGVFKFSHVGEECRPW